MICLWVFSNISLSREDIFHLMLAIVLPLVSIFMFSQYHMQGIESIDYGASSSSIASGGFGPNQVSAILGLGILLSFFLYWKKKLVCT